MDVARDDEESEDANPRKRGGGALGEYALGDQGIKKDRGVVPTWLGLRGGSNGQANTLGLVGLEDKVSRVKDEPTRGVKGRVSVLHLDLVGQEFGRLGVDGEGEACCVGDLHLFDNWLTRPSNDLGDGRGDGKRRFICMNWRSKKQTANSN